MSQKAPDWFRSESGKREYAALSGESAAIGKRLPWLLCIGGAGLFGVAQLLNGRGDAFRHTFGEFGETFVMWALLICSAWLLVDFFRGRTVRARLHVLYVELSESGHSYSPAAGQWVREDSNGAT
jgi:hypothetical protein